MLAPARVQRQLSGMTLTADADELEYRGRLQRALGHDFELHDLIGRGGFGSVYSAWDRKLEREVAVKALRHDLFPTRMILERFQREARAVAKLRHANILPVYAVGEGEGVAYMVMPVIHGENLRARIDSTGKLDPRTVVRIISDMARALSAAHRLGIIHRDVKPENILLEGDERHPLLSDFGIAKSADAPGGGGITGTGVILGSPHYMSPEQAAADKELDGRSDIYSLGAVAYEMLAGRRPYEASNLQQLLVAQFTTEPPALDAIAPDVPTALGAVVMRALARDPAQRWQSASEFASALEAAAGLAVAERGPQASWFARRGPVLALAYAIGIYVSVMSMTILIGNNPGTELAERVLARPLALLAGVTVIAVFLELLVIVTQARRAGVRRIALWRLAFGQPRWWQAWYPRSLRDPENVWDRMPWSMRVMRTIIWIGLVVVPMIMPLLFFVDDLATFAAAGAMPLPLPLRIMIVASSVALQPLTYGLVLSLIGAAILARRRGVPASSVLKLLFTWRASAWDTPEGQRLRSPVLPRT